MIWKRSDLGIDALVNGFLHLVTIMLVLPRNSLMAGSVITANLPPNTAIVNIDARVDGAAAYNGDQSLWYQPFSTAGAGNLLEYTVSAGTYGFRVIDPADAAQLFPSLTQSQTNQIFTAWTFNAPWVLDYLVFDSSAASNASTPQLFDGATGPLFGNAQAAYTDAITNHYYNLIRPGPLGRDGTNFVRSYTFTNTTTLIFVIPDYGLYDNAGGVSVVVSPVAPLLTIASSPDGTVELAWPTNAAGYFLTSKTNLATLAIWGAVTNVPTVTSSNYTVTLPSISPTLFFRLQHN